MSTNRSSGSGRATFLPMILGSMVLLFFLVFLVLITSGFFLNFLLLVGFIVPIGMMHYALWGRSLEQEGAPSRQRDEVIQRVAEQLKETPNWTPRS